MLPGGPRPRLRTPCARSCRAGATTRCEKARYRPRVPHRWRRRAEVPYANRWSHGRGPAYVSGTRRYLPGSIHPAPPGRVRPPASVRSREHGRQSHRRSRAGARRRAHGNRPKFPFLRVRGPWLLHWRALPRSRKPARHSIAQRRPLLQDSVATPAASSGRPARLPDRSRQSSVRDHEFREGRPSVCATDPCYRNCARKGCTRQDRHP